MVNSGNQRQISLEQETCLAVAQNYFRDIVAPQAEAIDRHPEALKKPYKAWAIMLY